MNYQVTRSRKGWDLARVSPGWISTIATYPSRKAAVLAGRVLAGRGGSVTVTKLPRK